MGVSAALGPSRVAADATQNKLYLELVSQSREPVLSPEGHPSSLARREGQMEGTEVGGGSPRSDSLSQAALGLHQAPCDPHFGDY